MVRFGRTAAALAVLACPLVATSCGGQTTVTAGDGAACTPVYHDGSGSTCTGIGQIVPVTVQNFRIQLPAVIPTGKVTFVVKGLGPTLHEFNVAQSSLSPRNLPVADDDTVDDGHATDSFAWVGQVEGIDVGTTKTFTTNITAGHYVFYCNMDGHYMAGMSAEAVAG